MRPTAFNAPSEARLTFALIEDVAQLHAMADDWAALLERSLTNELTLHPDWMLTWWDVFGTTGGRALRSVAFYDGSSLVGLAPLLARKHKYKFGLPFRRLELLASGEDEMDEIASDYIGLVVERGYEAAVAAAFASALEAGELGPWDELVLPVMNGDSPLPGLIRDELNALDVPTTLEERTVSPYIPLPPTWEEYLALLKPSKRSQLRKSLRLLESWSGGTLAMERVRSADELEDGKRILERLHRERWGGDGVYRSDRYRAFHDRMMPKLLELGALDLGWMNVRGEPVAAYYNLRWKRRVGFYQAGRKLNVPEDVRVGVTMHALLIRSAIERGMTEYDFLAGTSQYKMALSLKQHPLVTLRAARPSMVETARRATEEAKRIRDVAAALTGEPIPEAEESDPVLETTEISIVTLGAHGLDDSVRPFFFGKEPRSLFGWYHPSRATISQRRAVVIAPPLGYENICAYPAMRAMAERLSDAGYPVLRFDYDGTGDSGGADADPGRVRAWIDSVGDAIDQARALSGLDEVCLFGIRMGATIAAAAAAERGDVERLVLWNPCATGRAYAREMKMFRQYAESTGELQTRPNALADGDEESGGFLLTKETLADLKKLDLAKIDKRPAGRVLVLGRDDVPDDDKVARAFEALGAVTTYEKPAGYAEMMVAPHKSVFPEQVWNRFRDWLGEAKPALLESPRARPATTARKEGIVAPGVREESIRFGVADALFGILCEPIDQELSRGKPLIIFTNTAGNYRIGPNRMYVEMARKLAGLGIASVRMDVSGIGDSTIYEQEELNHPYGDQLAKDVRSCVAYFTQRGRAKRFGVAGLCSGAFVAYHAALQEPLIESITLINPQTFVWEAGMSLEVNALSRRDAAEYYKRRMFSKEAWAKLLKGGVDPRHAFGAVKGRVADAARSGIAKAKAAMPGAASRGSELARAFDALCERGVDVHIVFAANDPGIVNLHEKLGASLRALEKRPNFKVDTIEGPDHSFTPLWAQEELDKVLVGHLTSRYR
ncbi:MAG: GNAT family N-acetyltransferase [Labilithrix sp.]|nr:GNAT family N-acetyltransferase [Labilithrix sp.]MCW5811294.1 GNAT family N-acetyltransferase [Labilithrix sp.]